MWSTELRPSCKPYLPVTSTTYNLQSTESWVRSLTVCWSRFFVSNLTILAALPRVHHTQPPQSLISRFYCPFSFDRLTWRLSNLAYPATRSTRMFLHLETRRLVLLQPTACVRRCRGQEVFEIRIPADRRLVSCSMPSSAFLLIGKMNLNAFRHRHADSPSRAHSTIATAIRPPPSPSYAQDALRPSPARTSALLRPF
jgi:hypothetical protein